MPCNREDNTIERVLAGKATKMLNKIRNIKNEVEITVNEKALKALYWMLDYGDEHNVGTVEERYDFLEDIQKAEKEMEKLYDRRRKLNVKVVS